jgi:hypothetical protein
VYPPGGGCRIPHSGSTISHHFDYRRR